jgi:peptidoglycan/LPS O-acetylase OafA/YrhL
MGDLGRFGVLLFFVHTSLVLMLSMRRLGLAGLRLYTTFMVRRIFRIYPLSILTVALVIAFHIPFAPWFSGAMGAYAWPGWLELLSNLTLIQTLQEPHLSFLFSGPFLLKYRCTHFCPLSTFWSAGFPPFG